MGSLGGRFQPAIRLAGTCVPFFSEFTTEKDKVDETQQIYLADLDMSKHFPTWKYALMKIILEHDKEVSTPEIVMEHTRRYKEREDVLKRFIGEMMFVFI